ncbi:MAG: hypothetical protein KQH53_10775 [Desulfarculaceae bacterium]|nr:hypothetical protein [Desulfarculaceae bacterium]
MIRKTSIIFGLLLSLLLTAAPVWAEPDVSGHWSGTWTCTSQPCKIKGGGMTGDLKQGEHNVVTGTFQLTNTVKGTLNCTVTSASVGGDRFSGNLQCGDLVIGTTGLVKGNTIEGDYGSDEMGMGKYKLSR